MVPRLTAAQHGRCQHVLERLDAVWLGDDVGQAVAQAMAQLLPDVASAVHTWMGDAIHVLGHTFAFDVRKSSWITQLGGRHRIYDPTRAPPTANRAVTGSDVGRTHPQAIAAVREHFFAPHDLTDQLRVVLYERGEFVAWAGLLAYRDRPPFDAADAAMLNRVIPALCDRLVVVRAFAEAHAAPGELWKVIEAFDRPAFVLSPAGRVVAANVCARAVYRGLPEWLRAGAVEQLPARARCVPIQLGDGRCTLVVVRAGALEAGGADLTAWTRRWDLAAHLVPVARLVMAGLSDKQIAEQTGLSHATVRTYVRRVFRRVGVGSRIALLRAAAALEL